MRECYGYSSEDCDNMFDAEFFGYKQNIEPIAKWRANLTAAALAPFFGIKLSGF